VRLRATIAWPFPYGEAIGETDTTRLVQLQWAQAPLTIFSTTLAILFMHIATLQICRDFR
jgi:hypothetical protein